MELIKIYQGNLVDARELHQFLGSKRRFADWIKQRIERYDFKENKDFFSFHKFVKREKGARQGASKKIEYHLTITMAKELAMVENNQKGKEARAYFIKAEETLVSLKTNKRLEAFIKLEATKAKFKNNIIGLGGDENDYIQIDYKSRKVFFNGEPLEDEILNTVLMKGRDLAIEMTNGNILAEKIKDLDEVEKDAKKSHQDVRDVIIENMGLKPEEMPSEEKVKKLDN